MTMAEVSDIHDRALRDLGLSPEVQEALAAIHAELNAAYRESFIQLATAVQRQASALDRIQRTLEVLVRAVEPSLAAKVPPAIRVAGADEAPELASALVVADPIATGYSMNQSNLADALGLSQSDVSILVKAFKLKDKKDCAVTVREGKQRAMVNYHPRAIDVLLQLVQQPTPHLEGDARSALRRVRKKLRASGAIP